MSEIDEPVDSEHAVTPLELFFDLVFVFAITQVTTLLTNDPTARRAARLARARGDPVATHAWRSGWSRSRSTTGARVMVAVDGWRIAPEHFAERHALVVLIALGEWDSAWSSSRRCGGCTSTSPRSLRAGA